MNDIIQNSNPEVERIEHNEEIRVGEWFWINHDKKDGEEKFDKYVDGSSGAMDIRKKFATNEEFLGCITTIGSNFVELGYAGSNGSIRIHIKDMWKRCRRASDHKQYVTEMITFHQKESASILKEIQDISLLLGLSQSVGIEHGQNNDTRTLSTINSSQNIDEYKNKLIKFKKDLPELMEGLQESNRRIAEWTKSHILQYAGVRGLIDKSIEAIEDRVFNISIYAGFNEKAELIKNGKPADVGTKLTVMQRKLYMDEECIANYESGGIDASSIEDFDKWIIRNQNCIFVGARCLVVFQVRREKRDYDYEDTGLMAAFVRIEEEKMDAKTYIYIRNGEKIYRIDTELEFDDKVFPDTIEFNDSDEMYANTRWSEIKLMTKREYDTLIQQRKERAVLHKKWKKENKGKSDFHSPYRPDSFDELDYYELYNKDNLHYDEITASIQKQIKKYNRIALIIQGIFDRSMILHPHPPVVLWNHDGFNAAVDLIFDKDRTLYSGEKPDFEAYRKECNKSLKTGSLTIGQQAYWMKIEANRENDRQAKDWRVKSPTHYIRFQPNGNPGPGLIVANNRYQPVIGKCTFEWKRDKVTYPYTNNCIPCKIKVPVGALFNIEAYKIGDYKRFFSDPRTRSEYMKWAPYLILAEEYKLGNVKLNEDGRYYFNDKKISFGSQVYSGRY